MQGACYVEQTPAASSVLAWDKRMRLDSRQVLIGLASFTEQVAIEVPPFGMFLPEVCPKGLCR